MSTEQSTHQEMREAFFRGEIGSDKKPIIPPTNKDGEVSFRITGLGCYKTRDGRKAKVEREVVNASFCYYGIIGGFETNWKADGRWTANEALSCMDLIAPWQENIIPPPPPPITDPTYRPWTFEEVPLGAEICWADSGTRVRVSEIIVGRRLWIGDVLTITAGRNDYPARLLLDGGYLCSINGGPWRRCGVEIPTTPPCQSP